MSANCPPPGLRGGNPYSMSILLSVFAPLMSQRSRINFLDAAFLLDFSSLGLLQLSSSSGLSIRKSSLEISSHSERVYLPKHLSITALFGRKLFVGVAPIMTPSMRKRFPPLFLLPCRSSIRESPVNILHSLKHSRGESPSPGGLSSFHQSFP